MQTSALSERLDFIRTRPEARGRIAGVKALMLGSLLTRLVAARRPRREFGEAC